MRNAIPVLDAGPSALASCAKVDPAATLYTELYVVTDATFTA